MFLFLLQFFPLVFFSQGTDTWCFHQSILLHSFPVPKLKMQLCRVTRTQRVSYGHFHSTEDWQRMIGKCWEMLWFFFFFFFALLCFKNSVSGQGLLEQINFVFIQALCEFLCFLLKFPSYPEVYTNITLHSLIVDG